MSQTHSEKTIYKYVYKVTNMDKLTGKSNTQYIARVRYKLKNINLGRFSLDKLKEAAIAVDKYFISIDKPPVNILKKLTVATLEEPKAEYQKTEKQDENL